MDRGAWQAIVHGVTRVGLNYDLVTKLLFLSIKYTMTLEAIMKLPTARNMPRKAKTC